MAQTVTLENFAAEASDILSKHFKELDLSKDARRLIIAFARIKFDKGELSKTYNGRPITIRELCSEAIDEALVYIVNGVNQEPETYVDKENS
jgi:predicted transcriptional regulator